MRILNVIAPLDPARDEGAANAARLTDIWRSVGHTVSSVDSSAAGELKAEAPNHDVILIHSLSGTAAAAARRVLPGGPVPYFILARDVPAAPGRGKVRWGRTDRKVANAAAAVLFETEDEALRS